MRLTTIAIVLLAFPVTAAIAEVPNMTCKAVDHTVTGSVAGRSLAQPSYVPSDVFRIASGKLYHRWNGRTEYLYNSIVETELGRYVSGHMVFVIDEYRNGYVVIARPTDWQVYYLDCTS